MLGEVVERLRLFQETQFKISIVFIIFQPYGYVCVVTDMRVLGCSTMAIRFRL